jgi:hypothetical protein
MAGNKIVDYEGDNEKIRLAIEKLEEQKKDPKSKLKENFYDSPERLKSPFTSIGRELLLSLQEGLISELVIVSSYRKGDLD